MGLDITYYKSINFAAPIPTPADDEEEETLAERGDLIHYYAAPGFGTQLDGIAEGFYPIVVRGDGFRAGSYSGYNAWRRALWTITGWGKWLVPGSEYEERFQWDKEAPGFRPPFLELICFSDCEGCIGPRSCARLAADFKEWEGRLDWGVAKRDPVMCHRTYEDFALAFASAAGNGCVRFC
jgi:hypothetical protein